MDEAQAVDEGRSRAAGVDEAQAVDEARSRATGVDEALDEGPPQAVTPHRRRRALAFYSGKDEGEKGG